MTVTKKVYGVSLKLLNYKLSYCQYMNRLYISIIAFNLVHGDILRNIWFSRCFLLRRFTVLKTTFAAWNRVLYLKHASTQMLLKWIFQHKCFLKVSNKNASARFKKLLWCFTAKFKKYWKIWKPRAPQNKTSRTKLNNNQLKTKIFFIRLKSSKFFVQKQPPGLLFYLTGSTWDSRNI